VLGLVGLNRSRYNYFCMASVLHNSELTSLKKLSRGKVRDNYAVGDDKLLIVTSDRLSAFDVIMTEPIPDKGKVLNAMALFWFDYLRDVVPNHLVGAQTTQAFSKVVSAHDLPLVQGRSMLAKRLKPILVEAVVRGYVVGSGWKDYQATGEICGVPLPKGMQQAQQLATPIFTPADKAEMGEHDENISFDVMVKKIGAPLAEKIRTISLELYSKASAFAATKGIIIADTKFEFGLDENNELHLMDEVLTADSSRFWPAETYQIGVSPPSFDKQFVRDYLETVTSWGKTAPAPALPQSVIEGTAAKYREALQRLTGKTLEESLR
jgi:phosphoribosylaminoimidazole-succinocarboxamide synthase